MPGLYGEEGEMGRIEHGHEHGVTWCGTSSFGWHRHVRRAIVLSATQNLKIYQKKTFALALVYKEYYLDSRLELKDNP